MEGLLSDYSNQALSYDTTRSASPSVLAPLRQALSEAPGRRLLDVGGGTGNYALALAREGWSPLVADRSRGMLAQASAKGLATLLADAESLPLAAESFDAVMLVSMLHHVELPRAALAQAMRVLVPGGALAVMLFTREDISDAWVLDYFPCARDWMRQTHMPLAEVLEILAGAKRLPVVYEDLEDASLAALLSYPRLLLQQRWREQTSFFERLAREHPQELAAGLERLDADVAAGREPRRPGRASVIAWRKGGYQR
jgi:demethylmenaquinone methyltransferase/2-methoxy-6-polyprenyl-1,4-benzoquinol methylase